MPDDQHTNRLIHEKSPYLLQHAHNPVDWYPWGEAAFAKARLEDKPVFLSIGYSTCHWCHVMEAESFVDEHVAALLNRSFVALKVDREERPDIDAVYMHFCEMFTGSGGWPLSILMTPEQKPFFAATYLPKQSHASMPGLLDVLTAVAHLWQNDRQKIISSGESLVEALQKQAAAKESSGEISKQIFTDALSLWQREFDPVYGGFSRAPKFPAAHQLLFLLSYAQLAGDQTALSMSEKTLQQMYRGGIFDHIGYGFSRYATDRAWLIPHFEKMLYDNALLTMAYLEAYHVTKNPFYRSVAEKIIAYIGREMTAPEGAFYAAQDADSPEGEGAYYAFTPEEILAALGQTDGSYWNEYYRITAKGNFAEKNIPNLLHQDGFLQEDEKIAVFREKVYAYRKARMSLATDDKILTAWNGLMIVALAKAYQILGEERYLQMAQKAFAFITDRLFSQNGRLLARYRDGEAAIPAYLDDYACLVWAALELYEATFADAYLERACQWNEQMIGLFYDQENGGFYLNGHDSEHLLMRPKEIYDGAQPSGNAVAIYNLLRLARLGRKADLQDMADQSVAAVASSVEHYPTAYSFMLLAFLLLLYPSVELICVAQGQADYAAIRQLFAEQFIPNHVVLVRDAENTGRLQEQTSFLRDYPLKNGQNTYYLCANRRCQAPVNTLEELKKLLKEVL